jgi:mRNA interferase MazF
MKGKVVLVPFPFTDLTAAKLRPALVLYEGKKDVVLSFISSKVPSESSFNTYIILRKIDKGFEESGLKVDSVIRLDKIATVLKDLIVGELGELTDDIKLEINKKLMILFKL